MIQIRRITTANELFQVQRLRYEVYVEEMSKQQACADHINRVIAEELDERGIVFGAFEREECVGTVRYNWIRDGVGKYHEYYRLHDIDEEFIARATMTTKLMLAKSHRDSSLGMRLAKAAFADIFERGGRYDFIDCNPHANTRPFFEKMGYRQIFPNFHHAEYGEATPMILVMDDREHLAAVRSPFLRLIAGIDPDPFSVAMFHNRLVRNRDLATCTAQQQEFTNFAAAA